MLKKKKNSRTIPFICIGAAVYILLLLLLVRVESASPDSGINSISAGLWYTITTLTTVGYGDLYPVTAAGKAIGVIFQLMSLGVLVALLSVVLSFLKGSLMPRSKLFFSRSKDWYIFAERNQFTESLAEGLEKEQPEAMLIFSERDGASDEGPGFGIRMHPTEIFRRKKDHENVSLFFMSRDILKNELKARYFEKTGARVCCLSGHEPECLPAGFHVFNPYRSCARLYWNRYPVNSARENVVIIGDGRYAYALLEQALMINVCDPFQHSCYRMFGDYDEFRRLHPYMDTLFAIGRKDPCRDSLIFSSEPWDSDFSVLQKADRIIVCSDEEEENISVLTSLYRYCPVQGRVFAKLSMPFDNTEVFGSYSEIFSPEYVLREELNRNAVRLHEIYRSSSSGNVPEWNDLGSFTRRSNLASADHIASKIRILLGPEVGNSVAPEICRKAYEVFKSLDSEGRERCRRIEHERWMRFHVMNNWQYAEKRDNALRLHPLIRPYDELSPEDQAKDDYGWMLLEELGEETE